MSNSCLCQVVIRIHLHTYKGRLRKERSGSPMPEAWAGVKRRFLLGRLLFLQRLLESGVGFSVGASGGEDKELVKRSQPFLFPEVSG